MAGAGGGQAAEEALYGPGASIVRPEGPAGHFRTSVHASPLFAAPWPGCCAGWTRRSGGPAELGFVDMGAGPGRTGDRRPGGAARRVAARARAYAVERADRPAGLDHRDRVAAPSRPAGVTGLLFANEWLDNVPVDVAEVDADGRAAAGARTGGRDASASGSRSPGRTRSGWRGGGRWRRHGAGAAGRDRPAPGRAPGPPPWPPRAGARGGRRLRAHRADARPPFGTLTGFREGRETAPGAGRLVRHHRACGAGRVRAARGAGCYPAGGPARPGRHAAAGPRCRWPPRTRRRTYGPWPARARPPS